MFILALCVSLFYYREMGVLYLGNVISGLWAIICHDLPGVLLRLFGWTLLLTVVSVALATIFHLLVVRPGRLKLGVRLDRFLVAMIATLVFVSVPILGFCAGVCLGTGSSAHYLIMHEHLGQRCGKVVFKTVAAGVASERLERYAGADEQARLAAAKALMNGEHKIPISELHHISAHHAGQVSAARLEQLLPIASDGKIHHGTVWVVEKSISVGVYAAANHQGDLFYKFTESVVRHDAATDGDGLVTVQEVSDIACKVFLDKTLASLSYHAVADFAFPLLGTMALVLVVPWPLMALIGWGLRRYAERKSSASAEEA